MGDAGIGLSPGPNAMHFNSAKLAFVEEDVSFATTYTPWLRELGLNDVYLLYITGFKKIDDFSTFGGGIRYFSLGEIDFRDLNGLDSGSGRPREMEISASYNRKLTELFSVGLTGKYIYSNLASGQVTSGNAITAANSFAADVSFFYTTELANDNQLAAGLTVSNLGSKISYTNSTFKDFLPGNIGLGAAYTMNVDEYNSITFALDINKQLVPTPIPANLLDDDGVASPNPDFDADGDGIADYQQLGTFEGIFGSFGDAQGGFSEELQELAYSFGFEYWYDKQLALRAGYYYESEVKGDRQFLTVGAGLKYNVFGINLSYLVPTNNRRNPLDNTLRFTLNFDFAAFRGEDK